jgi:protein involved in temperature-dependent protein secretion
MFTCIIDGVTYHSAISQCSTVAELIPQFLLTLSLQKERMTLLDLQKGYFATEI